MRLTFIGIKDGKRRFIWPVLAAFVLAAYTVVIGAAEVFWLLFTGGFSPLVAGLSLVLATLLVVRVVGESLAMPV